MGMPKIARVTPQNPKTPKSIIDFRQIFFSITVKAACADKLSKISILCEAKFRNSKLAAAAILAWHSLGKGLY